MSPRPVDRSLSPVAARSDFIPPDATSIMSASSNVSLTREDTQSMVPMAGSFTSDTNELPPLSAGPLPANENTAGLFPASDMLAAGQVFGDTTSANQEPEPEKIKETEFERQRQHSIDVEMAEVLEEVGHQLQKGSDEDTPHHVKDNELVVHIDQIDSQMEHIDSEMDSQIVPPSVSPSMSAPHPDHSVESPKPDLVAQCEGIEDDKEEKVDTSSDEDKFEIVENNGCS